MKTGWRHRQRGATFLGILIIGGILACGVYAGIRLVPLYTEYYAVKRALDQIAKEGDGDPASIRTSLERRWAIDSITSISHKDIAVTKIGAGTQIRAQYRAEAPFVANISLVVDFDKSVIVGSGGGF
jgi:hypothetical protein